jgi:U3 small nucleolar RNA-associated protein 10
MAYPKIQVYLRINLSDCRIHQFPVTAATLLFTLMPYHITTLFGRILQIVTLQPNFSFLAQYNDIRASSTLPPVPRQLFIRSLSRDPVFLEAYFTFVVTRVKGGNGYSSMITLWSGLTIEAVLQMRQARKSDETIVSQIMPFVAQGLQMKQSSDFQIATYMVLTILASNRTLTDKVINAAMDAICLGWTDETRRYGLMCLATLAQREGELLLTDTVVQSLLSLPDLMTQIQSLPSKTSGKLLVPLATKLITSAKLTESQFPILTSVINTETISLGDRQIVIQAAVNQYLKGNQKSRSVIGKWLSILAAEHAEDLKSAVIPLVGILESAHLTQLEKVTQLQLKVCQVHKNANDTGSRRA